MTNTTRRDSHHDVWRLLMCLDCHCIQIVEFVFVVVSLTWRNVYDDSTVCHRLDILDLSRMTDVVGCLNFVCIDFVAL